MAKISIIVPVYKVEVYLQRCIDSIMIQTFKDFELILVDDGSPDNCPKICDEYAKRDKRIHVIHQKNAGLSAARNTGIDWVFSNSNSEWLTFVDSDDWIHPRMLELLIKAVEECRVDIGICGYKKTSGDELEVDSDSIKYQLWNTEDFFVHFNVNCTVAWGKLYKRVCFSTVRYPVGKIHEDEFTTYKIVFKYEKVAFIEFPLYAYFINPKGIMRSKWSPSHLDGIEARLEQIAYFEEHHFESAEIKTAKTLLWLIEDQLTAAEKFGEKRIAVYLRGLLKKEMKKYKKRLKLSPNRASYLYEAAYPKLMKLYWISIALLKRLHFLES